MFLFQNLVTDGLEIAFSITVWGTSAGGLSLFSSSLLPPLWEMGRKRIKRKVMVWSDSYREALIRSMVEQLVFVGLPRRICHSLLPVLLCASVFLFCTYCKDKFLQFPVWDVSDHLCAARAWEGSNVISTEDIKPSFMQHSDNFCISSSLHSWSRQKRLATDTRQAIIVTLVFAADLCDHTCVGKRGIPIASIYINKVCLQIS